MSSGHADVRGPLRQPGHSKGRTQPPPGSKDSEWLGLSKPGQLEAELHKIRTQMCEGRSVHLVLFPSGLQGVGPLSRNGGCLDSSNTSGGREGVGSRSWRLGTDCYYKTKSNVPGKFGNPALVSGATS